MPRNDEFDDYFSDVVKQLPEGSSKDEYEFWKAPDLLGDIKAGRLPLGQILWPGEIEELRAMLSGLIGLFIVRHYGGEHSSWQLNVIHKFIFPQKFEVPWTLVESLSKKYESGHLIRGWAVRRLMYELADLLELANPEADDPTTSTVSISPGADQKHPRYELVKKHCKRKMNLQTLAIRIYLELIQNRNEDGKIDERSLRRDLKRLRAWEDDDLVHTEMKKEYAAAGSKFHWKSRIPIRLYSESFTAKTPARIAESELLDALREYHPIYEE